MLNYRHLLSLTLALASVAGANAVASDLPVSEAPILGSLQTLDVTIGKLERKVCGTTNNDQPSAVRMEALEKKVFGVIQSGSLVDRLSNLQEKIEKLGKDEKTSSEFKTEMPGADDNRSADAKATTSGSKHTLKGTVYQAELLDCGIEAREEQIDASHTHHVVKNVRRGSRAERWGIIPGDIVLSVQTSQSSTNITIERGSKIYSADLSRERELDAQAPAKIPQTAASQSGAQSAKARPQLSPVGRFVGILRQRKDQIREFPYNMCKITNDNSEITTEFQVTADGLLTGSYSQNLAPPWGFESGILDDARPLADRQFSFQWHDKHGNGWLIITFSPDFNSFHGDWSPDIALLRQSFGIQSNEAPTLEQIELYGLIHDGTRVK